MNGSRDELRVPPDLVINSVHEAYERGHMLEALRRAETFAPLQEWGGIYAGTIASRLATNLGAPRLARRLVVRNWRQDPTHPLSQFEYGLQYLKHRGGLLYWHNSAKWPAAIDGKVYWQADLLALKIFVACDLRDFDNAEKLLLKAETMAPGFPVIRLQRAHLLERLDQIEESLEVAQSTLKLHPHPFYRAGVQAVGHLLQLLDRDDDAIGFLQLATQTLQNGPVAAQLFSLLAENQRWSEAEVALEQYVQLSPLLEKPYKNWVAGQRARTAYYLGRRTEVVRFARLADDEFNRAFAEKLEQPEQATEKIRLEVPFVRQNFKTCAPATQAALGRYWHMPDEHLKLVEAMCYDGTPHWKQRDWSEQNGWVVREFRVTWEAAVELLTRGIPFAITTVEAASAHMQAVMGFDRTRESLLLRDPYQPYSVEWPINKFFGRYRPFGPHGMLMLPKTEASRIVDIELPDQDLYDAVHTLDIALANHERSQAQIALEKLEEQQPDHPITWESRQKVAAYDANPTEEIRCLDRLLELFPNSAPRILQRLWAMRTASREEQLGFLQKACECKDADPSLFFEMARLLTADARQHELAHRWILRAFKIRPLDSGGANVLAELTWREEHYAEATELYRFAATLENFREPSYKAWFVACRQTRQTTQALEHLQDRFRRFGKRSTQPAFTLAWVLQELEQPQAASEVLAEAMKLLPDDGYLWLRAATLNARLGQPEQARKLLELVKGKVRESDRLRAVAEVAEIHSETAVALASAREILRLEPLAIDAHNVVARNLAILEGRSAALAHLSQACAAQPNHCALRRIYIEWARGINFALVNAAADDLLKISPGDAWTRRERAWALVNQHHLNEGLVEAQAASGIEPRNTNSPGLVARILVLLHRQEEARIQFRQAIELSVDNDQAISGLLSLSPTDQARKAELSFIEQELVRQVVHGNGLLAFGDVARPLMEAEALLNIFRKAQADRPDLWHAWLAVIDQLVHLGRHDEAVPMALKAIERFPHLPRVWLSLSKIYQLRHEVEPEIAAAQRAFEINPAWNQSAFVLAGALGRHRTLEDAKIIYERALHHLPNDPMLHAQLGSVLWRLRHPDDAFAHIEKALQLNPDYQWAWNTLHEWANSIGKPDRVINLARELTKIRAGEPVVWLHLARALEGQQVLNERLDAVDRVLALEPHSIDGWDLKIELLATHEDFDASREAGSKALETCSSDQFIIRGRLAWVNAQQGKLTEAVREMRSVLSDNTGYVWGWQQISAWLMEQEAYSDAENATEQLLKLQPRNNWAQRQLAVVRLKQGDRAGAEKVFSIVLADSPTDYTAAVNLFNLQLESANLTGAAETLRRMQAHQPGARTLAHAIMLTLRQGDRVTALKAFKELLKQPDPDSWPIQAASATFKKAGLGGKALTTMKRALRFEDVNPLVGAAAIQVLLDDKHGLRGVWLFGRIQSVKARQTAAPILAKGLGTADDRILLRILLWRHYDFFHQDDHAWAQTGYALARFKRMKAVTKWMSDWRSRNNLEPWMLFNLCYALRDLGRYQESSEAVMYAVDRWGHRHQNAADLRLFQAVEQALAGETSEAMENLQLAHVRPKVAYDLQLHAIAKSLVEFQQADTKIRPQLFISIRQRLDDQITAGQLIKGHRDVRRTFRRAGLVMTQSGAGWKARLWFVWKLNWQWLLLPLVPIAVALATQPPILVGLMVYLGIRQLRKKV